MFVDLSVAEMDVQDESELHGVHGKVQQVEQNVWAKMDDLREHERVEVLDVSIGEIVVIRNFKLDDVQAGNQKVFVLRYETFQN